MRSTSAAGRAVLKWLIAVGLMFAYWQWPASWWLRGDMPAAEEALAAAEAAAAAAAEALPSPEEVQAIQQRSQGMMQTVVWRSHPEMREPHPVWWSDFWQSVYDQAPRFLKKCNPPPTLTEGGEAPAGVLAAQATITFESSATPNPRRPLESIAWLVDINKTRADLRLRSVNVDETGGGTAEFDVWVLDSPAEPEDAPAAADEAAAPEDAPAVPEPAGAYQPHCG